MRPSRTPHARSLVADSDEYALWDAAYVLGSLSSPDRREFEAHLSTCPPCRESVGELGGMPALLAQLTRDDVAAIDKTGSDALPPPSPLLLADVRRRRRRSRLVTWIVGAAAAVATPCRSAATAGHPHRDDAQLLDGAGEFGP
jgi:anti-sigma factor RsiW